MIDAFVELYFLLLPPYKARDREQEHVQRMDLSDDEIQYLCLKSREIFLNQPMLLDLQAPITICGELLCDLCVMILNYYPVGYRVGRMYSAQKHAS